jgi:hypothetical protein
MKKPYYVLLTGGKNNAGDHLIKLRAKLLLQYFRPDREIVDLNGWEPFSEDTLNMVNHAEALILTGGPALQRYMVPNVYALCDNLEDITVPVLTMGIGWHSKLGSWESTHHYALNHKTKLLLDKIERSGYLSSVRDYHTLNVLSSDGKKSFLMTGCPALYDIDCVADEIVIPNKINTIAFSLGVSLQDSKKMFQQMQDIVRMLSKNYPETDLKVVFHHSFGEKYLKAHGANNKLYDAQKRYIAWLDKENINYVDISGDEQKLISYYRNVDLHIGYRVHAHIFMSSISKPSILLSEDGRGKALKDVLGGVVFDAYKSVKTGIMSKVMHRLSIPYDMYVPVENVVDDVMQALDYEISNGIRLYMPKDAIRKHYPVMKRFLEQLP